MESTLVKQLLSITLACVLIVAVKSAALVQYWQQTHHIFLQVEHVPRILLPDELQKKWHDIDAHVTEWMTQYQHRMLLAGQLLLIGDDVLPRIEVPAEVPLVKQLQCPEPVVTETVVCSSQLTDANNTINNINHNTKTMAVTAKKDTFKTQAPTNDVGTEDNISVDITDAKADDPSSDNAIATIIVDPASPINLAPTDKVLLIGDSLMQGVAPHIMLSIKRKFGAQSVDLSRHSTGLTYPSFFNWPDTLKKTLEQQQYAAVVVFLGANDPWDMNQNGHYIRFGSVKWKDIYRERVAAILQIAVEHKTRVIWLGAPPMGREDLTNKVPLLNEIYAEEITKQPMARFIPTGPKLTSDGVTFAKFIELPERGNVIVRTDDGVHFTPQGQRILAALTLDQFASPHPKITTR